MELRSYIPSIFAGLTPFIVLAGVVAGSEFNRPQLALGMEIEGETVLTGMYSYKVVMKDIRAVHVLGRTYPVKDILKKYGLRYAGAGEWRGVLGFTDLMKLVDELPVERWRLTVMIDREAATGLDNISKQELLNILKQREFEVRF